MFLSLYVRREVRNSGAVPLLTVYRLVRKKRNRGSRNNLKHWRVFVLISYFNLSFLFFVFFHWLLRKETEAAGTIYGSGKYVDCEQKSQIHDQLKEKSIFHNHDTPLQSID